MARSTIIYTSGPAGSGKSMRRAAIYVADEFLRVGKGVHYSNFPFFFDDTPAQEERTEVNGEEVITYPATPHRDGLVSYMAKPDAKPGSLLGRWLDWLFGGDSFKGMSEDEVRRRVQVIPAEEMKAWENEDVTDRNGAEPRGPWDWFADIDLGACHVAIDEVHHYCGAHSPKVVKKRWQKWLGELRHRGATIEFLSQHPTKVAKEIDNEAEQRITLMSGETKPDPFTKLPMSVWYQWQAKFSGRWNPARWQVTQREVLGKWKISNESYFYIREKYFGLYNSFSAPIAGDGGGAQTEPEPYTYMNVPRLALWTFSQAPGKLLGAVGGAIGILLMLCFPGQMFGWMMSLFLMFAPAQPGAQPTAEKQTVLIPQADGTTMIQEASVLESVEVDHKPAGRAVPDVKGSRNKPVDERLREARIESAFLREELERKTAEASRAAELRVIADAHERALQRAFAVSLITKDAVTFAGGYSYAQGEEIDFGPYKGLKVNVVDWKKRAVELSSGEVLRMGFVGLSDPELPIGLHPGGIPPTGTASGRAGSDRIPNPLPRAAGGGGGLGSAIGRGR